MKDWLSDTGANDISFDSAGNLRWVSGVDALVQRLRLRVLTPRGAYPLDLRFGVPYFYEILGSSAEVGHAAAPLIANIAACPGVKAVTEIALAVDPQTRKLSGTIRVQGESEEALVTL